MRARWRLSVLVVALVLSAAPVQAKGGWELRLSGGGLAAPLDITWPELRRAVRGTVWEPVETPPAGTRPGPYDLQISLCSLRGASYELDQRRCEGSLRGHYEPKNGLLWLAPPHAGWLRMGLTVRRVIDVRLARAPRGTPAVGLIMIGACLVGVLALVRRTQSSDA